MNALNSTNFEFHGNMTKHLSAPSKMLLEVLSEQAAQNYGIRYHALKDKIIHCQAQKSLGRGSTSNYAFKLLKDCLLKLQQMGMVHISRKPIGMETLIVLLISNEIIVKMKDFDKKKALEEFSESEDRNSSTGAMEIESNG